MIDSALFLQHISMKASKLIDELQSLLRQHGDLEVYYPADGEETLVIHVKRLEAHMRNEVRQIGPSGYPERVVLSGGAPKNY